MTKQNKFIVFNSTMLFVIASILEMTLHELGHFIMAYFVSAHDVVLYHNYVSDSNLGLSLKSVLLIKGAGPVVSLIIGVVFHLICMIQRGRNMDFLFNLYMSAFGYIGFFGYLMIAPLFADGDTGSIFFSLGFPLWLIIAIAVLGAAILYFIMVGMMRYCVEMGTSEIAGNRKLRIPFVNSLIFFPLLIGIVITTLLNLPVPTLLSLIAPLCSPFTIMWAYGYALSKEYPTHKMNKDIRSISKIHSFWIIVFVMTVVLNRILVSGIGLD